MEGWMLVDGRFDVNCLYSIGLISVYLSHLRIYRRTYRPINKSTTTKRTYLPNYPQINKTTSPQNTKSTIHQIN